MKTLSTLLCAALIVCSSVACGCSGKKGPPPPAQGTVVEIDNPGLCSFGLGPLAVQAVLPEGAHLDVTPREAGLFLETDLSHMYVRVVHAPEGATPADRAQRMGSQMASRYGVSHRKAMGGNGYAVWKGGYYSAGNPVYTTTVVGPWTLMTKAVASSERGSAALQSFHASMKISEKAGKAKE